jgi:hypothetical protein
MVLDHLTKKLFKLKKNAASYPNASGLLPTQTVKGEDNVPFVSAARHKRTKSNTIWVQYTLGLEMPLGLGFKSSSLDKIKEKASKKSLPQTPKCVGAFDTRYALISS